MTPRQSATPFNRRLCLQLKTLVTNMMNDAVDVSCRTELVEVGVKRTLRFFLRRSDAILLFDLPAL